MSRKPVVIYGASGYTGRLVTEFMRNYDIPFIAAGRSKERLEEAMKLVPGIETADFEIVEVEHTVEALTALFTGAEVVCNTVGPFLYFGADVVEACANAKVHYLDSTGEAAFMTDVRERFGETFAANGKVLAPSTAYMHTVSEIAALTVLETPGIDTLEVLCAPTGVPTFGSTQTIFSLFSTADQAFYLENNKRVVWPAGRGYEVSVPGKVANLLAHNWGGGSLPLFFEFDPRVRNVRHLTAFTNRDLMEQLVGLQQMYEAEIKDLPEDEQVQRLAALGEAMQPGMPPRENPLTSHCWDIVHGRGGNTEVTCQIRSFVPYQLTGLLHAATASYLIGGHQRASGFVSACEAVGYKELFGQITNFGFAEMEVC